MPIALKHLGNILNTPLSREEMNEEIACLDSNHLQVDGMSTRLIEHMNEDLAESPGDYTLNGTKNFDVCNSMRMKSIIYIILVAAAVVGEIGILYDDVKEHFYHDHSSPSSSSNNGNHNLPPNPPLPPTVARIEALTECVSRISGSAALYTNSNG